jgi:HEAT repeat protein
MMRIALILTLFLCAGTSAAQTPVPAPSAPPRAKAPTRAPTPKPRAFVAPAPGLFEYDMVFPDVSVAMPMPAMEPMFAFEPMMALEPMIALPDFSMTVPATPSVFEYAPGAWSLGDRLSMATAPEPFIRNGRPASTWLRVRPEQGTPEDSLYRSARGALSRGEYARASTLFQSLEQKYPRSRVAPAALYYRAFALYRAGATADLQAALESLRAQQERYAAAAADPEAATLRNRIYAALAARGDQAAASQLRAATAQGGSCDKEEMEVRASALSALVQVDPAETRPTLQKVLARTDECSVTLRRRAVYLLGRAGTEEAATDLLNVAKNDPDASVRSDAIGMVARSPGPTTVRTLEQLFAAATDETTRRSVVNALRSNGSPEARRVLRSFIEREELSDRLRSDAISALSRGWSGGEAWATTLTRSASIAGQRVATTVRDSARPLSAEAEEDAAYLRNAYAKATSRPVKSAIISAVGRIGGRTNDQWLMGIVRNRDEQMSLRREAISRLRPAALSVEEIGRLFDALAERELRGGLVSQLANRDDVAATDKLIEIARSGTDPELRRMAIQALARKNDPRSTKLLLEMVEKP